MGWTLLEVYTHSTKFCSYRKLNSKVDFHAWCPSFITELWWKASTIRTMTCGSRLQLNDLWSYLYNKKKAFWIKYQAAFSHAHGVEDNSMGLNLYFAIRWQTPGCTLHVRQAAEKQLQTAQSRPSHLLPCSGILGQDAVASCWPVPIATTAFPTQTQAHGPGLRPPSHHSSPSTHSKGPVYPAHRRGPAVGTGELCGWTGDNFPFSQVPPQACSPSQVLAFQEYLGSKTLFNMCKICKANTVTLP